MARQISFVTFGMFIIDEIEYFDGRRRQQDLIGGAGVYAALGARLAAGYEYARSISWIVDMGADFPTTIKDQIDQWNTNCIFRANNNRLTTRAWNGYGSNEFRSFKYLTPKIRLEVHSLDDEQTLSSSFHMVCSPSRCRELSQTLNLRRESLSPAQSKPIIIWEPIPDLCTSEELHNLQEAAEGVSVISPNADELAAFFVANKYQSQDDMVIELMGWNKRRALATHAVIREGAQGSTIYIAPASLTDRHDNAEIQTTKIHLPAYHTAQNASQVVDPTGGGNTYLGGLAIGMTNTLDNSSITDIIEKYLPNLQIKHDVAHELRRIVIGALYAVIAASYAIEQCGVPSLSATARGITAHESEQWNGDAFADRIAVYLGREAASISQQLLQIYHD